MSYMKLVKITQLCSTVSADGSLLSDSSSQYVPHCFDLQFMASSEEMLINLKDENEEHSVENTCLNNKMNLSQDAKAP